MTRSGSAHVPAHEDVACHIVMCHVTQAHPVALPRAPNFNVEDLRMHAGSFLFATLNFGVGGADRWVFAAPSPAVAESRAL